MPSPIPAQALDNSASIQACEKRAVRSLLDSELLPPALYHLAEGQAAVPDSVEAGPAAHA